MEPNYDDDDDTHFCIKCHMTVSGLDNYVRHRQTGCRPSDPSKRALTPETVPSAPVSYPEILNADAFFNSLELQSAKSKPRDVPAPEKKFREKRKKSKKDQEDSTSPKDKLLTLPGPVVTDLDDPTDQIGIPSLVGFPDIVAFTEKKLLQVPKPLQPEKKAQDEHPDWLNSSFDESDDEKPASEVDDGSESASEFDYDGSLGSESVLEDPEQDSYTESDDPDDQEDSRRGPSGGKWKPDHMLADLSRQEDEEEQDEDPEGVPAHTGGKWKPAEKLEDELAAEDEDLPGCSRQPPPGHTRGKWIPGDESAQSTPGFWCGPCGRKLASKLVYSRHLRSDLHARRCIQEIEGDVKLPRSVAPLLRKRGRSKRLRTLALKPVESKPVTLPIGRKTRQRLKEILRCEMCHIRVRRSQIGKHLLSHYHCRVAGSIPASAESQRFILENMANVVRQSPFQCSGCRFYCNTEEAFLQHWRSALHADNWREGENTYICACCNHSSASTRLMERHLLSQEHRETVAMISGSVPVVVRRQRILSCDTCGAMFRYNAQLRVHAKDSGHVPGASACDDYQQKSWCNLCSKVLRSQLALQRHQLACHKPTGEKIAPYFCSFCSVNFETAWDAVLHRRTASHKQTVHNSKFGDGALALQRDCGHCGQRLNNLAEHKQHLLQCHPDHCHSCLLCGETFALSQDLSKHTRLGECAKSRPNDESNPQKCSECSFSSSFQAEFIYHGVLHSISDSSASLECPICSRKMSKSSLRQHIWQHTGEKAFSCPRCSKRFTRKSALRKHANQCSNRTTTSGLPRQKNYICLECNTAFYTKDNVRQHMLRHIGKSYKCGLPGCPTVLRTETELKRHRALIHDSAAAERLFRCDECSYAAKTNAQLSRHRIRHRAESHLSCTHKGCNFMTKLSGHLKRHMRLHTGAKPYRCRHCPYASNNIENLRKHVLSTALHPGKMIYECGKCGSYRSNYSRELRAHLMQKHPEEFPGPSEASAYVSAIFSDEPSSIANEPSGNSE